MQRYVIGLDEVGRGALAGPVVVGCVALQPSVLRSLLRKAQKIALPLRDSKQLTATQRQMWCDLLRTHASVFCVTKSVSAPVVDKINISASANRAAGRAFEDVVRRVGGATRTVWLDGGLYLYDRIRSTAVAQTIAKADRDVPVVALASIVAKVARDARMETYGLQYPQYGFGGHKGYGTKAHYAALGAYGPCPLHRLTFL